MSTRRYCDQCEQDLPGVLAPWKVAFRNRFFSEEFCCRECLAQWLIAHPTAEPPDPAPVIPYTGGGIPATQTFPSEWRWDPT